MARVRVLVLCLAALCTGCHGAADRDRGGGALPEIELVRGGRLVALDSSAAAVLVERVREAMEVCNFSSASKPEIFGEDPAMLWTVREGQAHLRLRFPSAQSVDAVVGKLVYSELLLAVDQDFGPEPVLAKTPDGIVALKKCGYDDRLLGCAPELASVFETPAACPPGP